MQFDSINDLFDLVNVLGYSVMDVTEVPEEGYASVTLSYLQTPYLQDIPEDKDLILNIDDLNLIYDLMD